MYVGVCAATIRLKMAVRDISVFLDSQLDMSAYVSNACCGAYFHLFRIAKMRASLTTSACKTCNITPRLWQDSALWHHLPPDTSPRDGSALSGPSCPTDPATKYHGVTYI